MPQEPKRKKKLIIVHSIKGGCGKTTTSLALAQYFGKVDDSRKVCYIDADIVGPGTQTLSMMEAAETDTKLSFTDYVLLNPFDNPDFFNYPFEDNDQKKFDRFIYPSANPSAADGTERLFNAIFSSVNNKIVEKAVRATSDIFFAEDIKAKLKVLLSKLFGRGTDTIIIDTTPGMQGITKIILEIAAEIRNAKGKKSGSKNECRDKFLHQAECVDVIHILVSTNNYSHLNSLLQYLHDNRADYSEKEHFKYLILLNQLPIGYELTQPLKSNPTPMEMRESRSLKDYIQDLPEDISKEVEVAIKHSLDLYLKVRDKNFLHSLMDDYKGALSDFPEIKHIGEETVAIPDMAGFRRKTAHFDVNFKFRVTDYFSILSKQVDGGFFEELGKRVEALMNESGAE